MTVDCLYEYECYSLSEYNAFAGNKQREGKIIKAISVLPKQQGRGYIVIYQENTDFPDYNSWTNSVNTFRTY